MDLNHIEDGLRAVDLLEIVNDFQNRWLGTIKVQARVRLKRVSPWRGDENDDEMIGRVRSRSHEVLITAVDEFNRPVEVRDIPSRQVEDGGLDLKTYTLGTGQVPQDRAHAALIPRLRFRADCVWLVERAVVSGCTPYRAGWSAAGARP